ncbi:unnamed protein product, partial [Mesorhabditis belari]|uniref:Uncharacterized protein n=1 Tax=Mesorhabditis belari TaxID=2138241 RepID=A0AAF3F697_9BILA
MLLECRNQNVSHGILVNVMAGFEDVLKLGRLVEKLATVAGYQQVPVPEWPLLAYMSCGLEHEEETDEEIDEEIDEANMSNHSNGLDCKSNGGKMTVDRPRPILMFVEEKGQDPFQPKQATCV